ncbi:MAG: hypothetical protein HC897_04860, partial [Thermoanaerobaculia bacterium]|nr:hypothetical protein [Thermoanaerobaculia bacterium]
MVSAWTDDQLRAAREHHEPKNRGERHLLREQIESYEMAEGLELIEDDQDRPVGYV